jgi:hypothetical protein
MFNYAVNLWNYVKPVLVHEMWVVQDIYRTKLKYSDGNFSFYQFDYHKCHTDCNVMVRTSPQQDFGL